MALMPVADALAAVLSGAQALPEEMTALDLAFKRILARDLAALRTQPPQAMSAMDGYAVRAADAAQTGTHLRVIGEIAAGRPFDRPVGPGEAARIFTGGVVPDGADAVIIQEDTVVESGGIKITEAAILGRHIRRAGVDFHEGDVLLKAGRELSDRDLSLAASMNYPLLPVHRRPKVALLATGDELVMPGSNPGLGEIVHSNGYATLALARQEGCDILDLGIVPDRLDETVAAVRRARQSGADILVTSGGASVGDYDLVQQALAGEGLKLSFWKIAMRPGRPMLNGRLGLMHVLGVPGNPVSAYVCSFLFLVPLIRRLAGRTDLARVPEQAVLGSDLPANDERADYLRATLARGPDGLVATPHPIQDSSMLAPLARADCLLIREPFAPAAHPGSPCSIVRLAP